jgi:hypothetical protein
MTCRPDPDTNTYVAWRAGTTNSVVIPSRQPENRFLGALKGLQIRALPASLSVHTEMYFDAYDIDHFSVLSALFLTKLTWMSI